MPRPRKPTAVLELSGAFKHDPQRRRAREFEPVVEAPLGEPPEYFNEARAARWREIAAQCYWATFADRIIVERTAVLWQLWRDGMATPPQEKMLDANLVRLGLTPSDRSKVKAPAKAKPSANSFAKLA